MNIRMITREDIPCWYELSWQAKPPALILRIHRDFLKGMNINLQKAPIIKSYLKEFAFVEFSCDFERDIGFNRVLKRIMKEEEKDGFAAFAAKIPALRKLTNKECGYCEGSRKDSFGELTERECLYCEGTGRDYIIDWKPAETISASFTVLGMLLGHCENNTSAQFPQLMTVQTVTRRDMHGGGLGGDIGIPLRQWLVSGCSREDASEISKAMKLAYGKMLGLRFYNDWDFRVDIRESGGLVLDCPGDACGIHPCDWYFTEGKGYEFSCHNVDTPAQQLTLLAGLAALHDKARKELNERR